MVLKNSHFTLSRPYCCSAHLGLLIHLLGIPIISVMAIDCSRSHFVLAGTLEQNEKLGAKSVW